MCPACLTEVFGAVAGPAAGGAGALVLLWRRCNSAKPMAEPPTPTFQEWIAAIEASVTEHAVDGDFVGSGGTVPARASAAADVVSTIRGSEMVRGASCPTIPEISTALTPISTGLTH